MVVTVPVDLRKLKRQRAQRGVDLVLSGEHTGPPRTVAGYGEARALGVVEAPSLEPPMALPGLAAPVRYRILMGMWVPGFLFLVLSPLPRVLVPAALLMLAVGAAFVLRWWRRRVWEELDAGYITVPAHRPYQAPLSWDRAVQPWDDAGIWVLDSRGAVVHRPDLRHDPPGFYPVSSDLSWLQLWNGEEWLEQYRHTGNLLR